MSGAKQALQKGLALGFLDRVTPWYDIGQLWTQYLTSNPEIISERGAWSDERGNYFVAGTPTYGNQIYFIINDQLRDPTVIGSNQN
ncbi:MAG: hypothetical protein Q4B28_07740 [bacterium]|nr:hypothetical protein [bacterium]